MVRLVDDLLDLSRINRDKLELQKQPVVLSDVVSQAVKETWGSNPILVAITGWGQTEDKDLSRESGFDHHLVKPVDHDQLLELIQKRKSAKV